ncbi:hypothetical protein JYT85_02205 [Desulfocapsa sp. AH-315-G09]|nr:hypothetical protein [Desulfocapsa sp.]MBN4065441.1 hypothetical protein [Desulfocapsa sp. AH-315-G09]
MPNTLIHIGIQTPLTRLGIKEAPLQWIVVGCIIPDIPWIVQRIFTYLPGIDSLDLRLYSATQASLVYCLILSLALAMLASRSKQIFLILASNSLFHLLLDATQKKWGNGINLFVPFSWKVTNFGVIWPEHLISSFFILTGLITLAVLWPKAIQVKQLLQKPNRTKIICITTCLVFYFCSPALLLSTAYDANIHYGKTLSEHTTRHGKTIEIDRAKYNATTNSLECYIDTNLRIANPPEIESGIITIRGRFLNEETLHLEEYHIHKISRDYSSYIGLLLALFLWSHTFFYHYYKPPQTLTGTPHDS